MALGKKTGGREKGSRNKTRAINRAQVAMGLQPIDYMLEIMRDETKPDPIRMNAAVAAAPYIHAKLSSIEQKVEGKLQIQEVKNVIIDPKD
jgi:hypothetical protein